MYRVSILPALEHSYSFINSTEVADLEAAKAIETTVALLLIHLGDSGAMVEPYSNSVCIEQFVGGEWVEIEE